MHVTPLACGWWQSTCRQAGRLGSMTYDSPVKWATHQYWERTDLSSRSLPCWRCLDQSILFDVGSIMTQWMRIIALCESGSTRSIPPAGGHCSEPLVPLFKSSIDRDTYVYLQIVDTTCDLYRPRPVIRLTARIWTELPSDETWNYKTYCFITNCMALKSDYIIDLQYDLTIAQSCIRTRRSVATAVC